MSKEKKNKHIGSKFDDFLKDQGVYVETKVAAFNKVLAHLITEHMAENELTKSKMAKLIGTSRAGLERLLDAEDTSTTLKSLVKAAHAIGYDVDIVFSESADDK